MVGKLQVAPNGSPLNREYGHPKFAPFIPPNHWIAHYHCLVVWTPLKNISQLGWLFQIYGKIKSMFQSPPNSHWIAITISPSHHLFGPAPGLHRDSPSPFAIALRSPGGCVTWAILNLLSCTAPRCRWLSFPQAACGVAVDWRYIRNKTLDEIYLVAVIYVM